MKYSLRLLALLLLVSITDVYAQEAEVITVKRALAEAASKKLTPADIATLAVTDFYESGHNGVKHLYLSQSVNGLPVFNSHLTAALNADGEILSCTQRFFKNVGKSAPANDPSISALSAVSNLASSVWPNAVVQADAIDGSSSPIHISEGTLHHTTHAKLGYYMLPTGSLTLVWSFDIELPSGNTWNNYYVNAVSGELVKTNNWTVSCSGFANGSDCNHDHSYTDTTPERAEMLTPFDGSSYRVLAFPVESPNHGSRTLITEPADLTASPFGWHDINGVEGPEYMITRGNNVHAYEDEDDTNSPGFSPNGGANLTFDFPFNGEQGPDVYQAASIVNLFYGNNWIHDALYAYGFNELSGNFQEINYSGASGGSDYVRAEAQDGSGINNANMATPPDGGNPRMQMYLWTTGIQSDIFSITAPENLAGNYEAGGLGSYGPPIPLQGIEAELALLIDGVGAGTASSDGCQPATNGQDLDGKIVLTYRGNCNFSDKVLSAQNAGALACIVINTSAGVIDLGGAGDGIEIPSFMITAAAGATFVNALNNGTAITASLNGLNGLGLRDSGFDNGIVVHEYVHGLTNRLTGGPSLSNCLQNEEQMGEGWSDWYAMMLTMDMDAANPVTRPVGTFAATQPTDGTGIRPEPYDTSFSVNPFTYASLPSNALTVPHGVGFVWATMLWDLSWALMDVYGFDPDLVNGDGGNNLALQLVTDALKLQPCSPGFIDGRDAIILADELNNDGENFCLIWEVFAKRGLGHSADQGSSLSRVDGTAGFDLPPLCQTVFSAPTAGFASDVVQTCSGEVQFTDQSEDVAQMWNWDFGDGTFSTEQNPIHIYEEEGIYTVTLSVSNTMGESTVTQENLIEFTQPQAPIAAGGSGCEGEMITLSGSTEFGEVQWRNTTGDLLAVGNTFNVAVGADDTEYLVSSGIGIGDTLNIGPEDEDFGTGGLHATDFIGAVVISVNEPVTVSSAYVFSGSIGTRVISIWEGLPGNGVPPIDQVTVDIDFLGGGRIDLSLDITETGVYSIGLNQADLYRNDTGADYPYEVEGVDVAIVNSSAGDAFYYYLYDLEIVPESCVSEPVTVTVETDASASFEFDTDVFTVSFTENNPGSTSWLWDFGDGTTSTEQNPVHTYATEAVFEVTLTTNQCAFTENVGTGLFTGIDENESSQITIYPNPANGYFQIKWTEVVPSPYRLNITDLSGRLILETNWESGAERTIQIGNLPAGIYIVDLELENGDVVEREKLTVL